MYNTPVVIKAFIKSAICTAFFVPGLIFAQGEDEPSEVVVGQDGPPIVGVANVAAGPEWTFTFSGGTVVQGATHVAGTMTTATNTSTGIERFIASGTQAWFTGSVTVKVTHDDVHYGKVPKSILFQRYMQHEIDGSGRIPEATPITPTGQTQYVFPLQGGRNTGSTGWEYNLLGKYSTDYQFVNRAVDGTWTLSFATNWDTPINTWDTPAYQAFLPTKWKMNLRVTAVVAQLSIDASGYTNCKNSIVDDAGDMQVLAGSKLAAKVSTGAWDVPWQGSGNGDFGIRPQILQASNTTFDLPLNSLNSPLFAYKSFSGPGDPPSGNWDDHSYGATFKPTLQEFPTLTGISLANYTALWFYLAGIGSDVIKAHSSFTTEANAVPFNPSVNVLVVYPEQVSLTYDPQDIGTPQGSYGYQYGAEGLTLDETKLAVPYFKQGSATKAQGFAFRSKFKIPSDFYNGSSSATCRIFYQQLIAGFAYFQAYPSDTQTSVYWTDPTHSSTTFNFLNYRDGLFLYPKTPNQISSSNALKCLNVNGDLNDQEFIFMGDSPGLYSCNISDPLVSSSAGFSSAGSVTLFQQASNFKAYVMLKVGDQLVPVMYAAWGVNGEVKRKKYKDGADPGQAIDQSPGSITRNLSTAPTSHSITGKVDFPIYSDIVPYL